ncbi:hypothetical protein F5B17DRAFT_430479 [Nemania serpens]|nr:hypothetical protein F5B17DRAFT_430479 [Nemania serpens]
MAVVMVGGRGLPEFVDDCTNRPSANAVTDRGFSAAPNIASSAGPVYVWTAGKRRLRLRRTVENAMPWTNDVHGGLEQGYIVNRMQFESSPHHYWANIPNQQEWNMPGGAAWMQDIEGQSSYPQIHHLERTLCVGAMML